MKIYRIKHIPTGLYFCPSRKTAVKDENGRTCYVKTNLSKRGKVYPTKATLKWLPQFIWDHTEIIWEPNYRGGLRATPTQEYFDESNWVIEEGDF